jgi:Bifunctional DNA primase/polymerase, N-terminal
MPQERANLSVNEVVFGEAGPRMRRAGFAVLPAKGKKPLMQGFDRWKHAPGPAAVEKWAVRNPDADLVYVPGLSRAKGGGDAIIVVDGDDVEASGRIVELFGDTPGKVRTRRGRHFLYRDNGRSLGKVQSLRAYGLEADVKHGRSIVVAPPSRHAEDRSFVYTWDGCDETVIRDLPAFDASALQALIDRAKPSLNSIEIPTPGSKFEPNATNNCPPAAPPRLNITKWIARSQNSRGLALNRWLIKQLAACGSLDALLDCARVFDAELIAAGLGSLGPTTNSWNGQPLCGRTIRPGRSSRGRARVPSLGRMPMR